MLTLVSLTHQLNRELTGSLTDRILSETDTGDPDTSSVAYFYGKTPLSLIIVNLDVFESSALLETVRVLLSSYYLLVNDI